MNDEENAAPEAVEAPQPEQAVAAPEAAPPEAVVAPEQPQAPATIPAAAPGAAPLDPTAMKAEHDAVAQDFAMGHIKPETYADLYAKKDTLGKIGTLFGLLLSGAGSGLTGQPNAVMEMMKQQIGNDFEAQKSSAANAQNFYKLNLEKNLNAATIKKMVQEGTLSEQQAKVAEADARLKTHADARTQANWAGFHDLVQKVLKLPVGSSARMEGEKQLGILLPQVQGENYNIIDQAAAASALAHAAFPQQPGAAPTGPGQPLSQNNPEPDFQNQQNTLRLMGKGDLATANESKHFPGIEGQASVPLSGQDREDINSGINFQEKIKRFIDWTSKHSGELNPAIRKEGEALAAELQGSYRLVTKGGVYKEGEQGFISNIIKSVPTEFFNKVRVIPQLKAVAGESKAQLDQRLKSLGFQGGYKGKSTSMPPDGTKGTANGKPVVVKGGKWVPAQ